MRPARIEAQDLPLYRMQFGHADLWRTKLRMPELRALDLTSIRRALSVCAFVLFDRVPTGLSSGVSCRKGGAQSTLDVRIEGVVSS